MNRVETVYAQALYTLAREENCSETVLQQLQVLQESFSAEPDFLRLLAAPNLSKEERCSIADRSFRGKVHPYVLNFLKLLTEKGYVGRFPGCCTAYRRSYNRDHGILEVTAVTAVPLQASQKERLTEKLSGITGKTVTLSCQVDPAVLGGIRLDYDGKRLDDTLAHRLASVETLLKNTVL